MGREIFQNQNQAENDLLDIQLAIHCAPLLFGLRISLFLVVTESQAERLKDISAGTNLSYSVICEKDGKKSILLYSKRKLEEYFENECVKEMLKKLGYDKKELGDLICDFSRNYQSYMEGERNFPDEMGIFLGYPPEDVKGYMENSGNNFLCSGYWKVYENVKAKTELFEKMEQAKRRLISILMHGVNLCDAVKMIQSGGNTITPLSFA